MFTNQLSYDWKKLQVLRAWFIEPRWARQDQTEYAIRLTQREMQGQRSTHGNAAYNGAGNFQMIHESEQIIGERRDADSFRIAQGTRFAVRPAIECQQAKARWWPEQAERLARICPQAVLEEEWNS